MGMKMRVSCSVLVIACFLLSCTPQVKSTPQTRFYIYRFDPPAFVEISADPQVTHEIPFSIPADCGLLDTYPAPKGSFLAIELSCPNGQTVLFLDTASGSVSQPIRDTDSHFLAWRGDGKSAYLKIDSLNNARVIEMYTDGQHQELELTGWTYDLAVMPDSDNFTFSLSRGLGAGSELNFSQNHELRVEQLYADPHNYISFARYSPDGSQIAFIKIPDSQTPFTVGELWVIHADGTNARKLADADAGHGYAANWSPDGSQIAFVKRENPDDESANQVAALCVPDCFLDFQNRLCQGLICINFVHGRITKIRIRGSGMAQTNVFFRFFLTTGLISHECDLHRNTE